jgi:hypothetical protein
MLRCNSGVSKLITDMQRDPLVNQARDGEKLLKNIAGDQDSRMLLSERELPPLISGMMLNSITLAL